MYLAEVRSVQRFFFNDCIVNERIITGTNMYGLLNTRKKNCRPTVASGLVVLLEFGTAHQKYSVDLNCY
jgi:hypothetical protein